MKDKSMTVDQLYDYIVSQMTPEQALKKLLHGSLIQYEKLKFDSQQESVHPVIIITMAAMDLGWDIVIEKPAEEDAEVRGISVGTREYLESVFKKEDKDNGT